MSTDLRGDVVNEGFDVGIDKLASALAKAQSRLAFAAKSAKGNYGSFASLASCLDACRAPLSDNGLSVIHQTTLVPSESGERLTLITTLLHSSGQSVSSELPINPKPRGATNYSQALGSEITYMRRFALCALVGIAPEDDDGHHSGPSASEVARSEAEEDHDQQFNRALRYFEDEHRIGEATIRKWMASPKGGNTISALKQLRTDLEAGTIKATELFS